MTRFPTESRQVTGLSGEGYEPYEIGYFCVSPGCNNKATDRHHLFSRGLMGGAFDWVRLADGVVTGNIVGLCQNCHREVTENRVHITYTNYEFCWANEPLTEQPPRKHVFTASNYGASGSVQDEISSAPVRNSVAEEIVEKATCPGCGRRMPKPKIETPMEEKRIRKTWSVAVPVDRVENGADVIDELLDAAEEAMDKYGLSWGEGGRNTYFKLTTALALFVTHADQLLGND